MRPTAAHGQMTVPATAGCPAVVTAPRPAAYCHMMRRVGLMAVAIVLAGSGTALACSCVAQSDAKLRAYADAVFAGTVAARVDRNLGPGVSSADPIEYAFAVERSAKGNVADSQVVMSARSGATCGCNFPVGGRFVVFASLRDGVLWANVCGGSRALAAGESPFALRRVAVFGTYRGRVQRLIATVRPGEHPGRGAARILVARHPARANLIATAIPRGTRLLGYHAGSGTVRLRLSRQFARLSGQPLRLALAQIVFTMSDLPGVQRVRVRTELGPIPGFDRPLTVADFRRRTRAAPPTFR